MGSCSRRHFLLSICFLQLLFIIERQVFDFLGYMWAPILVNFFHIIFVIFGFFGAYQYRPKYLVTYSLWNLLWIGWNVFLICFYLNVGLLDRDSDLLNLGTGSVSWFEVNGYGCKPTYPMNITSEDPYRPVRPERVDGCLLDYHILEIGHSGVQCALALFGLFGAICLGHTYLDEDDSFDFMGGDAKSPQHTAVHPMYVSYTSLPTTTNSATSTQLKQAKAAAALAAVTTTDTVITANNHHLHNNSSSTHCLSNSCNNSINNNNNNSSATKLGGVIKSINGHNGGKASSSNTNTLLSVSSTSSPSSTFTHCNGSGGRGGQNHETHVPLHQQPLPRPLSRNSSFSNNKTRGQLRKNSASASSASIRYQDVIQQGDHQQVIRNNEDDTFFIPKSASCRNNFGISNPFNNVIISGGRYYTRSGDTDSVTRFDVDDSDSSRLITGSSQQLAVSTPLKRNPSVTSTGSGGPDYPPPPRIAMRPLPTPPPVPPLPTFHPHHQQQTPPQLDSPGDTYRLPYQYVTRSPNLNRIARRNNANLINNNSNPATTSNSSSSSSNRPRVMSPQYCDQIRGGAAAIDASAGPPGYPGHENNNYPVASPPLAMMHRAKSQDRLAHRSRRPRGQFGGAIGHHGHGQQQRPRSFCSNNGSYLDYNVILEHPGN
ncbi:sodium/potassium-transporting ATPase subunit beta-1-interacting protein isoform X1 [Culex quinquefasciatus]|uniref:sodium/potassium-transporting ATPase subunit beta-1-interacting protein isoform X1 n=1 Tax=Culex quinquefasciatus TaxID=7176 RepID=UPI0018E2A19E|nr:sodium/potassium-transporting ATPase subunit beta-1-interacting protein isoform X1 [Culex quinquefasciatus]